MKKNNSQKFYLFFALGIFTFLVITLVRHNKPRVNELPRKKTETQSVKINNITNTANTPYVDNKSPTPFSKPTFIHYQERVLPPLVKHPLEKSEYEVIQTKFLSVIGIKINGKVYYFKRSELNPTSCSPNSKALANCVKLPNSQLLEVGDSLKKALPSIANYEYFEKRFKSNNQTSNLKNKIKSSLKQNSKFTTSNRQNSSKK